MLLFIAKFLSIFFLEILLIALVNKIFVAITHQNTIDKQATKKINVTFEIACAFVSSLCFAYWL